MSKSNNGNAASKSETSTTKPSKELNDVTLARFQIDPIVPFSAEMKAPTIEQLVDGFQTTKPSSDKAKLDIVTPALSTPIVPVQPTKETTRTPDLVKQPIVTTTPTPTPTTPTNKTTTITTAKPSKSLFQKADDFIEKNLLTFKRFL